MSSCLQISHCTVLWKAGGGVREGRGGVGVWLRKGILARVSVPCVSRIISFNRTFGSYYIIEGGLRKGTASSRSVQAPLSGGAWNVLLISIPINSHAIGRGNNNLLNGFSTSKMYLNYLLQLVLA